MSGTLLDLIKSLVTNFVFTRKKLMMYSVLLGSLVVISTRSSISFCTSFMYMIDSIICKDRVVVLDCVESHWRWWSLSCILSFIPLIICVNWNIYQMLLDIYQILIQYVLWNLLLRRVYGISYFLKNFIRQRVCFWCGIWEASFSPFNWVYLNLGYPSWVCTSVCQNPLLTPTSILTLTWVTWRSYVKIYHWILGCFLSQRIDEWKSFWGILRFL